MFFDNQCHQEVNYCYCTALKRSMYNKICHLGVVAVRYHFVLAAQFFQSYMLHEYNRFRLVLYSVKRQHLQSGLALPLQGKALLKTRGGSYYIYLMYLLKATYIRGKNNN